MKTAWGEEPSPSGDTGLSVALGSSTSQDIPEEWSNMVDLGVTDPMHEEGISLATVLLGARCHSLGDTDPHECRERWYHLVGGGWRKSSRFWRSWAAIFYIGVWCSNMFILYATFRSMDNPTVFGAFFIVYTPQQSTAVLKFAQYTCIYTSWIVHIWVHHYVVCGQWETPSLSHGQITQIRVFCILFIGASAILLVVANVSNPGDWSFFVNVWIWGIGGAVFVWYPFVIPFVMLVAECLSHRNELWALRIAARAGEPLSIMRRRFLLIHQKMHMTSERFAFIIPAQLLTLVLSILTNSWEIFMIRAKTASLETEFAELNVLISTMSLVQLLFPLCAVALLNRSAEILKRRIAERQDLMPLAMQCYLCVPGVRIAGRLVTFVDVGLAVVYGVIYAENVFRNLSS